ncbi:MAG: hypothetical protein ABEJ30_02830 [Halorientalis sp.]
MSAVSEIRLYFGPNHTLDALKAIISGNHTKEQIADELGVTERTATNKLHDPRHLDLIEKNDGRYEATEEARRLIQLQEDSILEERFRRLPGVEEVLNRIENESTGPEEIGRVVSFKTGSGAADSERFTEYGHVYARWIEYLDIGEVDSTDRASRNPLNNDQGASSPKVPPQKVLDALRVMDEAGSVDDLANRLDYSDRETQKILTTAYGLGVAEKKRGGGFETTQIGRTVTRASGGKQREFLREKLLEMPLVQAYCNYVPGEEFENQAVMSRVSEEYGLGWSKGTVRTRAKRLYSWLIFTDLAEEVKRGVLTPTEKMSRGNPPKPGT